MKKTSLLWLFLSVSVSLQAQQAYLASNQTQAETPKFLPKNTAHQYVDFEYKKTHEAVELKWQLNKSFESKTIHLLKGVMNDHYQIRWQIIEEYGPLEGKQKKISYTDEEVQSNTTYYRLRISEDGDMVEYTDFYQII